MCGIAGIFKTDGSVASAAITKKMTDVIAHRGPDGEGCYADGPVALGHRRLSIIDLSASASQPMQTADGRYTITYNGELYNFRELRVHLEALGHQFRSHSDTEVILEAYAEWGKEAILRFNGMFAFAIWDARRRELLLARDRYGIKPLYYAAIPGGIAFCSEVKGILAHPEARRELNLPGLLEYFTFQNFFTDGTLLRGMRTLPAGTTASFSDSRPDGVFERYWDFDFRDEDQGLRDEEYLEELDRLVTRAISRQLVSDVEVGAYLSGGMDSGAITALAARELPGLKSFTVGFESHSATGLEAGWEDERDAAEFMSYLFQTEHYEMVLKSGDMERCLPRLVYHLDEPRVGQSYPNFYASQLAGKFVKVVLSGAGGDELFGGYPWRYYRAVVNGSFDEYIDKYYLFWQRLIPNRYLKRVFSPVWNSVNDVWTRDIFKGVFNEHAHTLTQPEDFVNHSLYFEAKTFLHGLLVVDDKLAMAHSLESRVPFLDNDLVDFAMKLPVHLKLGNLGDVVRLDENEPGPKTKKYFTKTNDGKLILRRCMERHVPREVTDREKRGFSGPDASWFRGKSIEFVRSTLYSKTACMYDYFDYNAVTELLDEHLDGRQNHRLLIWSLLNFELWCKTFL